jgi:ketosteroid isomerase-like protein
MSAIRDAMAQQEKAWDQGDIPGFMEAYSDTICFMSPRGKRCGKAEVQASYARNYPDQAAMGDLSFTIHEVLPAGNAHAWCTGEWTLFRSSDTLGGGFSLLWTMEDKGWRITRDHTY